MEQYSAKFHVYFCIYLPFLSILSILFDIINLIISDYKHNVPFRNALPIPQPKLPEWRIREPDASEATRAAHATTNPGTTRTADANASAEAAADETATSVATTTASSKCPHARLHCGHVGQAALSYHPGPC